MPERRSALARAAGTAEAVRLRLLPATAKFVLQCRPPARDAVGTAFGVTLPVEACRAHREAARAALWLGPHEWLLLAPEAEGADIPAAFAAAMADRPYSLVDVGHRSLALEISGAEAGPLLNAGCPLDLDIGAFPVGMCTRTILGKAQIVLWRTAPDSFTLDVWRSFSAYVWEFLEEARRGL